MKSDILLEMLLLAQLKLGDLAREKSDHDITVLKRIQDKDNCDLDGVYVQLSKLIEDLSYLVEKNGSELVLPVSVGLDGEKQ